MVETDTTDTTETTECGPWCQLAETAGELSAVLDPVVKLLSVVASIYTIRRLSEIVKT